MGKGLYMKYQTTLKPIYDFKEVSGAVNQAYQPFMSVFSTESESKGYRSMFYYQPIIFNCNLSILIGLSTVNELYSEDK